MLYSCATDECEENKNTLPLAAFYASGQAAQEVSIDSISVYGIGAPGDSILLDSASDVSQVYMPFNPDEDITRYVIRYEAGSLKKNGISPTDTITFRYTKKPWFQSYACGVIYIYDIDRIASTHTFIDSVTVPKRQIDNENVANIHIFFRTAGEGGER